MVDGIRWRASYTRSMEGSPDWSGIRAIVMDVDGTLTDGGIYIDDSGRETKRYDVRDGFGIELWHRAGGKSAVITGRKGLALTHRMRELRIGAVEQGVSDKVEALDRVCMALGVTRAQCVFVGDDLPDLAVMQCAGAAVAIAGAPIELRERASMTTTARGGHGAIREIVETILVAQGKWDRLLGGLSGKSAETVR